MKVTDSNRRQPVSVSTDDPKTVERRKLLNQILTAVVVTLLVGGTSPWWFRELRDLLLSRGPAQGQEAATVSPPQTPNPPAGSQPGTQPPPPANPPGVQPGPSVPEPTPDFPSGSRRVYSADFATWPKPVTPEGSITLGFANSYVIRPLGNAGVGSGFIDMPPLGGDFLFDVRFQIIDRRPLAFLQFHTAAAMGPDADSLGVALWWNGSTLAYTVEKGRIRGASMIVEQTIADREPLPAPFSEHDWSQGSKLTLRREGGEIHLFLNDRPVKTFPCPVFTPERLAILASFPSAIEVTSIEARTRM